MQFDAGSATLDQMVEHRAVGRLRFVIVNRDENLPKYSEANEDGRVVKHEEGVLARAVRFHG